MATLGPADLEHFRDRGYVRVRRAFGPDEAAAMRDATWEALARAGIRRGDPGTWTVEAPSHLQALKRNSAFRAVGSPSTTGAIDDLLGQRRWSRPTDWGAFFVLFPTAAPWTVPHVGWHLDHAYTLPVEPLTELKVQAMYGDVAPGAGGMTILAGSHHVVAAFAAAHPHLRGARPAAARKALMDGHPYLAELGRPGDRAARIARFVDRDEEVWGSGVRVVELTATAGDVVLIHPLVLHTRPVNAGRVPRFLLNKDLYRRSRDRAIAR